MTYPSHRLTNQTLTTGVFPPADLSRDGPGVVLAAIGHIASVPLGGMSTPIVRADFNGSAAVVSTVKWIPLFGQVVFRIETCRGAKLFNRAWEG